MPKSIDKQCEDAAEVWIRQSGRGVLHRLRDSKDLTGKQRAMTRSRSKIVNAGETVGDFLWFGGRHMCVLEVKSSHNKTAIPVKNLTRLQQGTIEMCRRLAGGGDSPNYLLLIYSVHIDEWYLIDGTEFMSIASDLDRKSVPWTSLTHRKLDKHDRPNLVS